MFIRNITGCRCCYFHFWFCTLTSMQFEMRHCTCRSSVLVSLFFAHTHTHTVFMFSFLIQFFMLIKHEYKHLYHIQGKVVYQTCMNIEWNLSIFVCTSSQHTFAISETILMFTARSLHSTHAAAMCLYFSFYNRIKWSQFFEQ